MFKTGRIATKSEDFRPQCPSLPKQLLSHLEGLGITTRTVEHPALFTVTQSRELRGELPGGHTKNLFLKDKKGRFFLVSCREDANVDLKRLHERLGASGRLSFGSAEQLMDKLGVEPGAVTLVRRRERRKKGSDRRDRQRACSNSMSSTRIP